MKNKIFPQLLKEAYERGENLSIFIEKNLYIEKSDERAIELSYDFQAGSYIRAMENENYKIKKQEYCSFIAEKINALGTSQTVLEAGVGEATTLSIIIDKLGSTNKQYYGFDISWSRTAYARKYLGADKLNYSTLFTASLMNIPLETNSIDIVYTSHSIEPNRNNEMQIIQELYRVTRKYLVMVEPAYELAPEHVRQRFDKLSYCRGILETCKKLNIEVICSELLPIKHTGDNISQIIIAKKKPESVEKNSQTVFVCPKYKTPLRKAKTAMYSDESMIAYPIIAGIPCLREENGIIATKFSEFE